MNEAVEGKELGRAGRAISFLTKLLAVAAVFGSVGGVFLHLSGNVAQSTYLRAFNVDSDGFSRGADLLMVMGYYSTLQLGLLVVESALKPVSIGVLAYIAVLVAIARYKPQQGRLWKWGRRLKKKPWFQRMLRTRWLMFLLSNVAISAFLWTALYSLIVLTMFVALVPGVIGERFAKDQAREHIESFKAGCAVASPCLELWRDDAKIATGYMVATTSDRIAFFDVQLKMVRQLERSGIEVRSPINPKFDPTGP